MPSEKFSRDVTVCVLTIPENCDTF